MKKPIRFFATMLCFSLLMGITASADSWIWEKGKWYYYTSPNTPLEKSWITYNGNDYYIGSKGLMQTGWFTDPDTGLKIYMGSDGIKKKNTWTEDKTKYVGPNSTELTLFDQWRDAAKKELKVSLQNITKKSGTGSSANSATANNAAFPLYYALTDLNMDGFRDIVIGNKNYDPDRIYEIKIWNPEDRKYYSVTESDPQSNETSRLRYNTEEMTLWLSVSDNLSTDSYFKMEPNESQFDYVESYNIGYNEYNEVVYYVNGESVYPSEYQSFWQQREANTGAPLTITYLPLDDTNITNSIDTLPDDAELELWQDAEDQKTKK